MIDRTHARIPRFDLSETLSRTGMGSVAKATKVRVFFGLGIILGLSVNLSSALADINDAINKDATATEYVHNVLPGELAIHFLVNNNDDFTEGDDNNNLTQYYPLLHTDYYDPKSSHVNSSETLIPSDNVRRRKDIDSFQGAFVPEAVWSLDVSTGAHLEHDSGAFGSGWNTAFIGYQKGDLLGDIFDPLTNTNTGGESAVLFPPLQFQVASCTGSAERPDLDHCNPNENYSAQYASTFEEQRHGSSNEPLIVSNNSTVISPNGAFAGTEQNQSGTGQDLSQLMPASFNVFGLQGEQGLAELCGGVSACAIIDIWYLDYGGNLPGEINSLGSIDPPIAPDPPIDPTNSWTPPEVISDGGLPGSGLISGSTPPIVSSAVPETSTWIMTVLGFSIIVAAGKRWAIHSAKQAAAGTLAKLTKQAFRHDTT